MRQAFTLIELMIVIAIIAIIAAIAIPNLLESRITAQESSAAAALKSGLLPAEVQFQAGGYCDLDGNGIGTYSVDGIVGASSPTNPYNAMSGQTQVGNSITLNLLAPSYATNNAYTAGGRTSINWPVISGFQFQTPLTQTAPSGTSDGTGERVWGVITFPSDDAQGRKFFIINQAGNIYMSLPANNASTGPADTGGAASIITSTNGFGAALTGAPQSTKYLPYRR